jgi:catecholate siderophore receptor
MFPVVLAFVLSLSGPILIPVEGSPAFTDPLRSFDVRGVVVDASGGVIVGAAITLRDLRVGAERQAVTDASGAFVFTGVPQGRYIVVAIATGFAPTAVDIDAVAETPVKLTLEPAPVSELVTVTSALPEAAVVSTATKIAASPMDIPQTIDAVPQMILRQQAALSMQDALRNVAGVTPNLGEGRRDQFLIRGFSATTDTFVDGVRDDALYYRDLATVDRIEVLKGPASALFGRGSSGGVINRVMKRPLFNRSIGDVGLMVGGFDAKRLTFDVGRPSGGRKAAYRLAGAWEDSGSFRDFANVSRVSLAPSAAFVVSPATSITAQAEYLHDARVPDRGIPSVDGRPADVRISQYYGFPADDFIRTSVIGGSVTAEHQFPGGWLVRDVVRAASYDTAWSNTQPIGVQKKATGVFVNRSQYNADQDQQNFFNQFETVGAMRFARATHVVLVGVESGIQQRQVIRFNGTAPDVALVEPALTSPVYSTVAATNNAFTGNVLGVYIQDHISIGDRWKALVGVRGDRYEQRLDDRSAKNVDLGRVDRTWSPRVGIVYQPAHSVAVYSSVSQSFQPSGEGLSLAVNNAELRPESTRNIEGGVKLSLARGRATATASVFRLDRSNIKTTDPLDTTRLVLVGRQRTDGVELAVDGALTSRWSVRASYADLDATILRSNSVLSGVKIEGNRPGLVPRRSVSLWSSFNTGRLTLGGGVTSAGDRFTSNDDLVTMPAYTRGDAFASYRLGDYDLSLNIQNLFNARYYESAGSNFQIYPGAPRHALVTLRYSFR